MFDMTELLDLGEAVSNRICDMEQCLKEITPQIGANAYKKNIKRIQELRSKAITDITDIEGCLEEGMESPQSRDIARDDFIKDLENLKTSIQNIEHKTSITRSDLHTASAQDPKLDQDGDTKKDEKVNEA